MSRVEHVTTIDDLDGSEGAEEFLFAVDGVAYTIDLSPNNSEPVREVLAPLVARGRKIGRVTKPLRRGAAAERGGDAGAIRAWCRAQGIPISDRGRISESLRKQYQQAAL